MDPWSRRREVARGVLRTSPQPEQRSIFAIGEGSRILLCGFYTPVDKFIYQTPGRRPPRISGRVVSPVTRGWVEAPNERAPFRIHDAVVGFVGRCLSGLGIWPRRFKHMAEFFSGRSWPKICPGMFSFSGFVEGLKLFIFEDLCS